MPTVLHLTTHIDERGALTVVEKEVPFPIRRVFYIYNAPAGIVRGGHGHKRTRMALVAAAGACRVSGFAADGSRWSYALTDPAVCLLLEPEDWHEMEFQTPGTVLLCLASEEFDPDDYEYARPIPIPENR
jgi:hypothetical protein